MIATDTPHPPPMRDAIAAALDWWREAGVDCDFTDNATTWLEALDRQDAIDADLEEAAKQAVAIPSAPPAPAAPLPERIDFFADGRPQMLDEFRDFWMSAGALDAIGPRARRVPPRGVPAARIMVLVVDPEPGDSDQLLCGPQGRLAARILSAAGENLDQAYFASALPRHTPMADTAALAAIGLGEVLRLHLELAAPQRVLAFGKGLAPLLATDGPNPDGSLREINQSPPHPPLLLSPGLDSLMDSPQLKARFWRRWIEWSAVE